jgi:hypothetical protein
VSIVRITAYGEFTGDGHNTPFHCDVAAVGKANNAHPYVVANELICTRLAMHLALPVPPGAVVTDANHDVAPDGLAYVSMNVYPEGERPPPADMRRFALHQFELTGITVFDAWIVSHDRHPKNILWEPAASVPLTFIDFELSLTAHVVRGVLSFDDCLDMPISAIKNSHHDQVLTWDHLARWLDRVESVDRRTIEEIVYEARQAGAVDDDEGRRIIQLLVHRRDRLRRSFEEDHRAGTAFRHLDRWGLV